PNEHVLSAIGGSWDAASVTGSLREKGWGAAMGYPGIDLDEHGDEVQGFLFSSEKLSDHWAKLDAFEGKSYERVLTVVKLRGNRTVDAYIYTLI
ncbi:MAG: gamma-glutamylcyclotransferase, partial [bacterium]|nr:gamma-glutamylcyclotransferase [bacterium]